MKIDVPTKEHFERKVHAPHKLIQHVRDRNLTNVTQQIRLVLGTNCLLVHLDVYLSLVRMEDLLSRDVDLEQADPILGAGD